MEDRHVKHIVGIYELTEEFISFLEYEEGLTKDPETAKRIKELLIKLQIWN